MPGTKNDEGVCERTVTNALPELSRQVGSCQVTSVPGVPNSINSVISAGRLTHSGGVVSTAKRRVSQTFQQLK